MTDTYMSEYELWDAIANADVAFVPNLSGENYKHGLAIGLPSKTILEDGKEKTYPKQKVFTLGLCTVINIAPICCEAKESMRMKISIESQRIGKFPAVFVWPLTEEGAMKRKEFAAHWAEQTKE